MIPPAPLIRPYDPSWALAFAQIDAVLSTALAGLSCTVEHVGSTAVPGLAAKPIIDIDIALPEAAEIGPVLERLVAVGYTHVGDQGIPLREVCKRLRAGAEHPVLDRITHHLYVCPAHSPELRRHLAFRDYLRKHEWARENYAALKQEIARAANQDRKAYAVLKEERAKDLVESIMALAERED